MSATGDFEEKANRLFSRLSAVSQVGKISKNKAEGSVKTPSLQELLKVKEEMQGSDFETRKKMRAVNDSLKKLEITLQEENDNRNRMDQTFMQAVGRLEKNMRNVLSSVGKSFAEKEKKLEEKIESMIKQQKKEIESKLVENEELIEQMLRLEVKVQAIIEEVSSLRKSRLQLEQKISKQFSDQIREMKRIFQCDIHEREQRENRAILTLKTLYKTSMQRVAEQQREREQNEKMLMVVVQQLINHIIEA